MKQFLLFLLLTAILVVWSTTHVNCAGYSIVGSLAPDPILGLDASISRLKSIVGTCIDPRNGDIYVLDSSFYRIFKIDHQTNIVSWYAGNGVQYSCYRTSSINLCGHGSDKKEAGFTVSGQCAVDPFNGDLYFTDTYHFVRKIDAATGILTIVGGTGWASGTGSNKNGIDAFDISVEFNTPFGLAVDQNFVYIADSMNYCIRKVNKTSNLIYTHAGSCGTNGNTNAATPTNSRFGQIYGMTIAPDGSMFVLEYSSHVIKRITPSGSVELYAGVYNTACAAPTANPACGDGSDRLVATFKNPISIALDSSNNVYIFDYLDYRIRKIDNATGIVSTLVGTGTNSAEATGPNGGENQLGTSVLLSGTGSNQAIAIYGNKLYYNDRSSVTRLRQVDLSTGIVTNKMGTYTGQSIGFGLPLISTKLFQNPLAQFDSNGTMYILAQAHFMSVLPNGILRRLAGGTGSTTTVFSGVPSTQVPLSLTAAYDFVIDKSNNQDIYIAESTRVRYFNASNEYMYTYAGGGASTTDGVAATSFSFTAIVSIALLPNGDLLIAEARKIRKVIKSSQTIVTIANTAGSSCSSNPCGDGGAATSATFSSIQAITTDSSGNIYVLDYQKYVLRMIRASNGNIELVAGAYGSSCASVGGVCGDGSSPLGAYLGSQAKDVEIHPITGDIYIADGNYRVRKISGGVLSTVVGSVGGSGYDYLISGAWADPSTIGISPTRISFSNTGQLYFDDGNSFWGLRTLTNNIVQPVSGFLQSDIFTYNGENISSDKVKLTSPTSVFIDSSGDFYIACVGLSTNYGNNVNEARIVKMNSVSNTVSTLIGNLVSQNTVPAENTKRLQTPVQPYSSIISNIYNPWGIHVTSAGDVYYADTKKYAIRLYNATLGTVSTVAGVLGTACSSTPTCDDGQPALSAHFKLPTSIFVTNDGTIYVTDTSNHQIRKVQNGIITAIAGSGTICATAGSAACDNSSPLSANLLNPMGIYVTASGEVYFADTGNHKIRKISSDGLTLTTVAGSTGYCSSGSTVASPCSSFSPSATDATAKLYYPTGVVVDETTQEIYIADQGTHTVRIVYSNGSMNIFAGSFPGMTYTSNSALFFGREGSSQYLNYPTSLFINNLGLYVTEPKLGRVRRLTPDCASGYTGIHCDIVSCSGVLATSASVCSGHGSCVGPNTCQCQTGFTGSDCSQPVTCYGKQPSDLTVCNGHGSCDGLNNCNCTGGYYGSECQIINCFDKKSNESDVCSGKGSCASLDNCTCQTNYYGDECQLSTCFGVESNSTLVCSGKGNCSEYDTCNCNSGFFGTNCNITTCYSINSNNVSVCNSFGTCSNLDTCQCDSQHFGSDCEFTFCFGEESNSSSVCNSRGSCDSFNYCSCDSNYLGSNCSITTCNGIQSNDSSVCSKKGDCSSFDNCDCYSNYYGSNCNITTCNGVFSNDSSVCNGKGICVDFDQCQCELNSFGTFCESEIFFCFGIPSNDSRVCSSHGSCNQTNVCSCSNNYLGLECQLTSCFSIVSNDSSVCSGNGNCSDFNICNCNSPFSGLNCSVSQSPPSNNFTNNTTNNLNSTNTVNTTDINSNSTTNSTSFNGTTDNNLNINSTLNSTFANSSNIDNSTMNNSTFNSAMDNSTNVNATQFTNSTSVDNTTQVSNNLTFSNNQTVNNTSIVNNSNSTNQLNNSTVANVNSTTQINTTNTQTNQSSSIICDKSLNCSNHGICSQVGSCECYSDFGNGFWKGLSCNTCQDHYFGDKCDVTIIGPAKFTQNFDGLSFSFISQTTISIIECEKLLSPLDLSNNLFGEPSQVTCQYSKLDSLMLIKFGSSNYMVNQGSTIQINANVFNQGLPMYTSLSVSIVQITPPVALMKYSNADMVGSCDTLKFDGQSSYSLDGKSLDFDWKLVDGNSSQPITTISFANNAIIELSSQVPPGLYRMSLLVNSSLMGQSQRILSNPFRKVSKPLPILTILGDTILNKYSYDFPLNIKKSISDSSCNTNKDSTIIEWSQISGPAINYHVDSYNNLVVDNLLVFGSKSYVFKVVAYYQSDTSLVTSSTVTLNILLPELKLDLIVLGSNSAQSVIEAVVSDREIENNPSLTESWNWSTNETNSNLLSLLQSSSTSKTAKLTISSSIFGLNIPSSIDIQLTIQKSDSRSIQKKVTIYFVNIPPTVNIVMVYPASTFLLQSQYLSIQALASTDSKINSTWSINEQNIESTKVKETQGQSSLLSSVNLAVDNLPEGSSNNLKVVIQDPVNSYSSVKTYSFNIAEKPKYCNCQINPLVGIVQETDFTFSCLNCQNAKQTLDFKYGFIDDKSGARIPLYNKGEVYSSKLPAPYSGSRLSCFMDIIDTETGAFTSTYTNITIYKPSVSTIEEIQFNVNNWTERSKSYLKQGGFSMSIYQSASTLRTESVLLDQTLSSKVGSRSSRSVSVITCSQGELYQGVCYCKDGYIGTACDVQITDFLTIQSSKMFLLESINFVTNYSTISEDYLSLMSFGIDSILSNYKYLNSLTVNQAIESLYTYLKKVKTYSVITLPVGVDKLLQSSIDSTSKYILEKKFTSNQIKNVASMFKTIKVSNLLATRSLSIGMEPVAEKMLLYSTNRNRNTLFDSPQQIKDSNSGVTVQLPSVMFKRELSGSVLQKSFGYALTTLTVDFTISTPDQEFSADNLVIVSPIVSLSYIDEFVSMNPTGIVYKIPIDETKEAKVNGLSPLDVKQSTFSYYCMSFDEDTLISYPKKCSLLRINNSTAECQCNELATVYIAKLEKITKTNLWFVIFIGLLIFCSMISICIIILVFVFYRGRRSKKAQNKIKPIELKE